MSFKARLEFFKEKSSNTESQQQSLRSPQLDTSSVLKLTPSSVLKLTPSPQKKQQHQIQDKVKFFEKQSSNTGSQQQQSETSRVVKLIQSLLQQQPQDELNQKLQRQLKKQEELTPSPVVKLTPSPVVKLTPSPVVKLTPSPVVKLTPSQQEQEPQAFLQIMKEYDLLKNRDYISHNILSIDHQIDNFKKKIDNFKTFGISKDTSSKIHEIEQHIIEKKSFIEKLRLDHDSAWSNLNINSLTIEELEREFTDLIIFGDKDSVSNSLILRGQYQRAPIFIKAFSYTEENLIEELKIYTYISEVKKHIHPDVISYMDNYFIGIKKIFSMNKNIFFNFLEKNNIQQFKHGEEPKTYYSTTKEAVNNQIPKEFDLDVIYFLVTEDIEGESLQNKCSFLNRIEEIRSLQPRFPYLYVISDTHPGRDTRKELINIIFELIYGLYLLNKYFRIEHNDLHFNNVIIKERNLIDKNFIIGKTTIKKRSNIRLAIYDFDRSRITSYDEAESKNACDISRIRSWFNKQNKIEFETTLKEISRNINLFESSNLEEMLLMFVHHYSRELDIEEIDPFFKKYLKYKNKYLQLKKNI
jgi:hypothetical protein